MAQNFRHESLPHDLDGYRQESSTMEMSVFEQRHPYPFLLYARSNLWDPELIALAMSGDGEETRMVDYNITAGGLVFISPIRKWHGGGDDESVFMGRSPQGNDVVVPVSSISTKHARFLPPSLGETSTWEIVDLDSRNGTFLGENRLSTQKPTTLDDGVYLRLGGNLLAWFLYPGRLWHIFQQPDELKRLTEF
jgi:hypothetical protein